VLMQKHTLAQKGASAGHQGLLEGRLNELDACLG
jgi:hypothetical protein